MTARKKARRSKRPNDKRWSERDLFTLGLGIGHGAARNLGREEAIVKVAELLKRQEGEVRDKLVEFGFLADRSQEQQLHHKGSIGKTIARVALRRRRARAFMR